MALNWIISKVSSSIWSWTKPKLSHGEDGIERTYPGETVKLSHGTTHYFLKGPIEDKTAPLVVFCHGASVFSFIWSRFAQMLASKGYRVLLFDFYGHGYSDVPDVNYSHHLYRQQLEELMEYLNLFPKPLDPSKEEDLPPLIEIDVGKPIEGQLPKISQARTECTHELYLIGHSMGGLVASEFASKHKNLVTKVVLFNSAGLPVDIKLSNALPFLLHHVVYLMRRTDLLDYPIHALGKALQYVGHKWDVSYEDLCKHAHELDEEPLISHPPKPPSQFSLTSIVPSPIPRTLLGPTTETMLSTYRFMKAIRFLLHTWFHQLSVNQRSPVLLSIAKDFPLLDADHSEALTQLEQIPVLVMWGEEDGLLPADNLDKFQKCLPHAVVLKIPKTDHAAFLQQPALVFETMMRFFVGEEDKSQQIGHHSVFLVKSH
jgi:pimeloyl-ACP methyl ester carboxylesterase